VLDTPTWRANPDWAASLGHDRDTLARLIDRSVELVSGVRAQWPGIAPALVSGAVGPRGDGYRIDERMDADQAAEYHGFQIRRLAGAGADVATAMTLGYPEEAIGIARAAHGTNLPVVISFTVETDGRLPCGATLREAIEAVDAATGDYPEHYMINCAHPSHFATVVEGAAPWASRLGGLRANASTRSHAELDEMTELDEGDPDDLASRYVELRAALPTLTVLGGCCGTDDRHVRAIATAVSRRPTP
jgi:homocysteine S-methyltransferase